MYEIIQLLMHRLRDVGITGKVGVWLHNFLNNRFQFVDIAGCKSDVSGVLSGVPQGTILGPILFLIFINSISASSTPTVHISSFADDTKVVGTIRCWSDTLTFQSSLESVYEWANTSNMKLNGSKFQLMRYGTDDSLRCLTSYRDNSGQTLPVSARAKDLGVIMSSDCSFSSHILKTV